MESESRTGSERLSAVESDVRHLDERINSLSRQVEEGFSGLRRVVENQRQPITAFAGWAAFVLALVGAVLWPQNKTDERIDADHRALAEDFREHVQQHSHPGAEVELRELREKHGQLLDDLKSDVTGLDVALQREMRILDDANAAALKALDEMLQREMRLLAAPHEERLRAIERELFAGRLGD